MAHVPGFKEYSHKDRAFLLSTKGLRNGKDALLASGQTQPASEGPDHRLQPGSVVVLDTASGKFYLADDPANGDRNSGATIVSSGYAPTIGTIEVGGIHGTISVSIASGTGTVTDAVNDLNGDDAFADHYVASDQGGELQIASKRVGSQEYLYIGAATDDGYGFAEGEANGVRGADADYRVTDEVADLQDLEGAAVDYLARTLRAGHFASDLLLNATAEALAVLERRGSEIEAS